mgnify:CR=1 FL=1
MTEITLRDDATPEPTEHGAVEPAGHLLPGEVRPHPAPLQYVLIAVVLVAITAVEVSLFYLQGTLPNAAIIPLLLILAILKFGLVASWYMHLRTDRPIFTRFFVLGIVAAVLLFMIVLTSLQIWS